MIKALACLVAVLLPLGAAQSQTQTKRLIAINTPLSVDSSTNLQASIWKDKLPDIVAQRKATQSIVPEAKLQNTFTVFVATFKADDETVVLSVLFNSECRVFSNVGLPESLGTCPMRVVVVEHDQSKVAYAMSDFPFAIKLNEDGSWNNYSQKDKTIVFFEPRTGLISTRVSTSGGPPGYSDRGEDTTIHLNRP
jgi:hypothetical protein